jgi:hypothetical protein
METMNTLGAMGFELLWVPVAPHRELPSRNEAAKVWRKCMVNE